MISLDFELPEAALVSLQETPAVAGLPNGTIWWRSDRAAFTTAADSDVVTAWTAGEHAAIPTDPNTGNGTLTTHGTHLGLRCQTGFHCGLVTPEIFADARRASIAIRYFSSGEARTLLTLNLGGMTRRSDSENYLFVSETGGVVTVKDDAGLAELTLAKPTKTGWRTILVSVDDRQIAATDLTGPAQTATAPKTILSGPARLFIGCRNQRPKLLKTLGQSVISDVWAIPNQALLMPQTEADTTTLTAFEALITESGDA